MSVIHAPEPNRIDAGQLIWPTIILVFFGLFVSRLWYLQIVSTDELTDQAKRTGNVKAIMPAPRGEITDRQGRIVATVKGRIVITARPRVVIKKKAMIRQISEILGIPYEKLLSTLEKATRRREMSVPILLDATVAQASRIAEAGDQFEGFSVESQAMRVYPDTTSLCHVLGYVGVPSEAILQAFRAKKVDPPQYAGRDGVEMVYESDLMGKAGYEAVAVDSKGRAVRNINDETPQPGSKVVLAIDLKLQELAQKLLAGQRGSIVALDPRNGEVLVLASAPGFDLASFENKISTEDYEALSQDKSHPMMKRALAGAYPPGSTFKLVTSMAAYAAGKFDPHESHFCDGGLHVGKRFLRCENHPVGVLDYREALTKSCNTFFGTLAKEAGITAFRKVFDDIKLGKKTGIDIPGESAGVVPTAAWVKKNKPNGWFTGDTVNVGIGQGGLALTPLQMACIVSLVANEGTSYRPHVVRAIVPAVEGAKPRFKAAEILGHFDASPLFWQSLKSAMVNVMVNGTGRGAQIAGLVWAGKTGSAEFKVGAKTHSWFVGYAPADHPRIAICAMVEEGGHGGTVAAPMAAQIVKAFLASQEPAKRS